MKIFISVSAGVTKEKWDKMTNAQKKAYIKKYPNSKYATDGKEKAAKPGKATKKIEAKKVSMSLDWAASKDASAVRKAITELNKKAKTNVKPGKIKDKGDNGYPEAEVIADSKAEMKKFLEAYLKGSGSDVEDYMDGIQPVRDKSKMKIPKGPSYKTKDPITLKLLKQADELFEEIYFRKEEGDDPSTYKNLQKQLDSLNIKIKARRDRETAAAKPKK